MDRSIFNHVRDCESNTNVLQAGAQITFVTKEQQYDLNTIAGRLAWARETRTPYTQTQLAEAAKVSQGTIGNIESGARKNPRELLAIARAAGVDPEWLKSGKGSPDTASDVQQSNAETSAVAPPAGMDDATVMQLARDLAMLTPGRRATLMDAIHQEAEAARELVEFHLKQAGKNHAPSMAAGRASSDRKTITIRRGDGNPTQGELAFTLLADPFNAEPDGRESEMYRQFERYKKQSST